MISNIPESLHFSLFGPFWRDMLSSLYYAIYALCNMHQLGWGLIWFDGDKFCWQKKNLTFVSDSKVSLRTKTVIRKIIKLWKQIKLLTGESRGRVGFTIIHFSMPFCHFDVLFIFNTVIFLFLLCFIIKVTGLQHRHSQSGFKVRNASKRDTIRV